jgi:acyl dehydratase
MSRIVMIGDAFSKVQRLAPQDIRLYAEHVDDMHPLHHDEATAKAAGFPHILASGSQTTAYFLAAISSHFAKFAQPLLQDFAIKVQRPVIAGDTLTMTWTVVDAFWKNEMNGDLTTLEGTVMNQREQMVLSATAKVLIKPRSAELGNSTGSP